MRDKIHVAVRRALEKDDWTISADPFYLPLDGTTVEIDLEAEKEIEGNQKIKIIYVEIKSMLKTIVYDFYSAYGQYEFYRDSLRDEGILHPIYLAIPLHTYQNIDDVPVLARWIRKHKINLLVVDIEKQETVKWINY